MVCKIKNVVEPLKMSMDMSKPFAAQFEKAVVEQFHIHPCKMVFLTKGVVKDSISEEELVRGDFVIDVGIEGKIC